MRHWLYDSGRGVLAYLSVLPICLGLFCLFNWLLPDEEPHALLTAAAEMSGLWRLLVVVAAALLPPLCEEVFFRGLVQSMLRRYLRSPWLAVILTSVFFAAVHASYLNTVPSMFVLAVAMGYSYERCGRLYPAILIHALFNAVSVAAFLSDSQAF